MSKKILLSLKITFDQKGQRLDVVVAKSFPQFSRNHLQKLIKDGHLKVDGKKAKPKDLLRGSEEIEINYLEEPSIEDKPEDINLDIIYEQLEKTIKTIIKIKIAISNLLFKIMSITYV